jgi:drug/metabolite transporter (DMT)-like permease
MRTYLWFVLLLSAVGNAVGWLAQKFLLHRATWTSVFVLSAAATAGSALLWAAGLLLGSSEVRRRVARDCGDQASSPLFWAALVAVPLVLFGVTVLVTHALSKSHVSFFTPTRTLLGQLLLVVGAVVLLGEKGSPWMYAGVGCLLAGLGFMVTHTVVTKNGWTLTTT